MTSMAIADDYLTVSQAAARIGVTTGRVRQWLLSGEIRGEQVPPQDNGRWLISSQEVDRMSQIKPKTGRPRTSASRV